jgi:uncharacterized alpha-E superfamily protein
MPMLSRVADSLYWMGRYIERSEHMARLLEVTRDLLVDLNEVDPEGASAQWKATVATLAVPDIGVEDIVFNPQEPASLVSCMMLARENARQVREVIAADMWEHLNQAYWWLQEARTQGRERDEGRLVQALTHVQTASFVFDGVTDASMRRDEGWLFLKLGKFVERTDRLSRTIGARIAVRPRPSSDAAVTGSHENFMWITLLKSAGGLEEYRKAYPTRVDAKTVLDFLVFDPEFPRAVRFGTRVAFEFAQRLSALHASPDDAVSRAFGKLSSRLEYGDVDELMAGGPAGFLTEVLTQTTEASALLARKYFLQ